MVHPQLISSSLFSEHTINYSDLDKDREATLNSREDSHNHEKPPPVLEVGMPVEPQPEILPPAPPLALEMREEPQSPPNPAPAPPLVQQPVGKVHNKRRVTIHLRNEFRSCGIILLWCNLVSPLYPSCNSLPRRLKRRHLKEAFPRPYPGSTTN